MGNKTGVKTSEFWVTLGLTLLAVVLKNLGLADGAELISLGLLGGSYNIGRGQAKKNVVTGDITTTAPLS